MGALGDHPIATMTTRDVATFLRSLDEGEAKPRTINRPAAHLGGVQLRDA
jgi:hypothetical protein